MGQAWQTQADAEEGNVGRVSTCILKIVAPTGIARKTLQRKELVAAERT